MKIWPNPGIRSQPLAVQSYKLIGTMLTVRDMKGRVIGLIEDPSRPGFIVWHRDDVPAGVYVLTVVGYYLAGCYGETRIPYRSSWKVVVI